MNPSSTTSSTKNGIHAGNAVLWARGSVDANYNLNNQTETFTYDTDKLHSRLTGWKVNGQTVASLVYGDNGNITKKSDVSTASNSYKYQHPQGKPHAVTAVSSPTVEFQQNALNQNLTFTPFNKVSLISNAYDPNFKLEFTYGPDDQRSMTKLYRTSPTKPDLIKFFTDNYEYEIGTIGLNRHLHYLNGPDGLFAIMVKQGSTETMYYVHKDYLGSISAITDATGNLVESLSYDPWGRRRKATDWTDYNVTSTMFDRGYTGHEHLPQFGLINMNGRVYDPFLARFLSPDPFVQAPDYSQNFNRYSYAFNNPLKYTDPDGEWVHLVVGAAIGGVFNWLSNGAQFNAKGLGYFGVGALAGGLSAGIGAGFGAALAGNAAAGGGFAAGFMGTATISSTGFAAGAISGAAAGFTNGLVSGTGNQLIQGKKFGDAFVKGGLGQAWRQGLGGAAFAGILSGIDGKMNDRNFWTGSPKQDVVGNNHRIISKADYDNSGSKATKDYYDTFIPENSDPFSVEIKVKGMKEIYPDKMTWQPKSTFPYSKYTVNGNKVIVDFPTGNYADGVLSIKGWRWQHSSQHYGRRLPSQYIYSRRTLDEYGGIFFYLNFLIK